MNVEPNGRCSRGFFQKNARKERSGQHAFVLRELDEIVHRFLIGRTLEEAAGCSIGFGYFPQRMLVKVPDAPFRSESVVSVALSRQSHW